MLNFIEICNKVSYCKKEYKNIVDKYCVWIEVLKKFFPTINFPIMMQTLQESATILNFKVMISIEHSHARATY